MKRGSLWLGLVCAAACALAACTRSNPSTPDEGDGEAGSGPDKLGGLGNSGRSGLQPDAGGGERDSGGADSGGAAGSRASGNDAGSGGSDPSPGPDAATDAATADSSTDAGAAPTCEPDEYRCTPAGRERCNALGAAWESTPCPLDTPACDEGECVLRGPTMVRVGSFYVDSTEVTVGHYLGFLDARREDTDGQPGVCSWNTSFYDGTPSNPDNFPITNVDWCDARAFCAWAGKRLCGAIGGGAVENADALEPSKSQWMLACGGENGASHPAGGDPNDCNSTSGGGLRAVGSTATCEGFFPGLFDLEGNAAEWIDSCASETGAEDICYLVGGSHIDSKSYCTEYYDEWPRNDFATPWGFRCCSG